MPLGCTTLCRPMRGLVSLSKLSRAKLRPHPYWESMGQTAIDFSYIVSFLASIHYVQKDACHISVDRGIFMEFHRAIVPTWRVKWPI